MNILGSKHFMNPSLSADLLRAGIGYHHAGMSQNDRNAVENVFGAGHLPVLIATSTLGKGSSTKYVNKN